MVALAVLLSTGALGCGGDEAPTGCPEANLVAGTCAGVPPASLCDTEVCTANVECIETFTVHNDAELSNALAAASPGSCIALTPGQYQPVSLPAGVKLLGMSAWYVQIAGLSIEAGSGAYVRGLTVLGGVTIEAATDVTLEAVRVISGSDAINVSSGSSVRVLRSELAGLGRYGLFASGAVELEVSETLINGSQGPGLWVECGGDCCADPAAPKPMLSMSHTIIRQNHLAGVALFGTIATLDQVSILETKPGDVLQYGEGGGGLTVASCSDINATGLRVEDSSSFGVLVDASSGTLGTLGSDQGVTVSSNGRGGIWAQNIPEAAQQALLIENANVDSNDGVGVGFSGEAHGIIFCRSVVSRTRLRSVPVKGDGASGFGYQGDVGDGVSWQEESNITIDTVSLTDNERTSLLIDGPAAGTLKDITVTGSSGAGFLQQNLPQGGSSPMPQGTVPPLQMEEGALFNVPVPPGAISGGL